MWRDDYTVYINNNVIAWNVEFLLAPFTRKKKLAKIFPRFLFFCKPAFFSSKSNITWYLANESDLPCWFNVPQRKVMLLQWTHLSHFIILRIWNVCGVSFLSASILEFILHRPRTISHQIDQEMVTENGNMVKWRECTHFDFGTKVERYHYLFSITAHKLRRNIVHTPRRQT